MIDFDDFQAKTKVAYEAQLGVAISWVGQFTSRYLKVPKLVKSEAEYEIGRSTMTFCRQNF